MDELNGKREALYNFYLKELKELAQKSVLTLPTIPKNCTSNYHLFHIILESEEKRNSLMSTIRSKGIGAAFHYIPLHLAPAGLNLGYKAGDFPLTEEYAGRLLRLPLYPDLTVEEAFRVVNEISAWANSN
jgi:dTDP-4-amino-4,6-dideoxygalactose transaminase